MIQRKFGLRGIISGVLKVVFSLPCYMNMKNELEEGLKLTAFCALMRMAFSFPFMNVLKTSAYLLIVKDWM